MSESPLQIGTVDGYLNEPSSLGRAIESALGRGSVLRNIAAVLDQALFAGGHFLIHLILARWLAPAQYGAFAVAYSVIVLMVAVHGGIVTEPMLVLAPARYRDRFGRYLGAMIQAHLGIILLAVAAGVLVRLLDPAGLGLAGAGAALAGPCVLLLWLGRRAFYVRRGPGWAVLASAVYVVAALLGCYLLLSRDRLSALTAFIVLGVSAAIAAFVGFALLRPEFRRAEAGPSLPDIARDHWGYGKWALGAGVLAWLPWNAYFAFLPLVADLESVGALRASANLVLPMLHLSGAIGVALLPELSRLLAHGSSDRLTAQVGFWWTLITAGGVLYMAVLLIFGGPLMGLLYGGQYTAHVELILPLSFMAIFGASVAIPGAVVRARLRPDQVCVAYGLSALLTVTAGLALALAWGTNGAAFGMAGSYASVAAGMIWFYARKAVGHAGRA